MFQSLSGLVSFSDEYLALLEDDEIIECSNP